MQNLGRVLEPDAGFLFPDACLAVKSAGAGAPALGKREKIVIGGLGCVKKLNTYLLFDGSLFKDGVLFIFGSISCHFGLIYSFNGLKYRSTFFI